MENPYLKHYRENRISPVRQNLTNVELHAKKRIGLYRHLGIPPLLINNRRILEVGPGSGHNAIVTAGLKPCRYVLIEPNKTGCDQIRDTFADHDVDTSNIDLCNTMIENYSSDDGFDLIFCEGMIPGIVNKAEVLSKIDSLLNRNGVLVLTCVDEISLFYEIIRIYFAHRLTSHLSDFESKINLTSEVFAPHLSTIPGFSRLIQDWCADCLFGEAHFHCNFSIRECIKFFTGKGYFFYQACPQMFNDYTWYKSLPTDIAACNDRYIKQFDTLKHNLMLYTALAAPRPSDDNEKLLVLCSQVMAATNDHVCRGDEVDQRLMSLCHEIVDNLSNLDSQFSAPLHDIISIIEAQDYFPESISTKYKNFTSAFGRGQQYVSLLKN